MVGRIEAAEQVSETESSASRADVISERRANEDFLESIDDPEIRDAFKKLLRSFAHRKAKA